MATGFVWHEHYMWHSTGNHAGILEPDRFVQPGQHFESPETKRRFKNLLEVSGLLEQMTLIRPRPATDEEIGRVHTADYMRRIQELSAHRGGDAGLLTPFWRGGYGSRPCRPGA